MGMALPEKPPLMLVETSALNDAEEKEGRTGSGHSHGPVFHTRGLTLTVEYKYIQHVTSQGGRQITQAMDLSARNRYEVGPRALRLVFGRMLYFAGCTRMLFGWCYLESLSLFLQLRTC